MCVCDFKGVVVVETTHKASNKSLFFPLLYRESFPFPHKEEEKKEKKVVHMSIRVYSFNKTLNQKGRKKMKEKKDDIFPACLRRIDIK